MSVHDTQGSTDRESHTLELARLERTGHFFSSSCRLEEEFEITIPDEEAEKIKTVGEAIDYIMKELEKK